MKKRTLNKRLKRINKYKMLLLKYINEANKYIDSKYLLTEKSGFRMYVNYLHYLYKYKKYKQFYYEIINVKNIIVN